MSPPLDSPMNNNNNNNKRKTSWNLEHIVLKLKQSKKPEPLSPLPTTKTTISTQQQQSEFNYEDEEVLSPVFPRDISEHQKNSFLMNEKSSLMTQLEQKDNEVLMMNKNSAQHSNHKQDNFVFKNIESEPETRHNEDRQTSILPPPITTRISSKEGSRDGSVTSSGDEQDIDIAISQKSVSASQKQKLDELNRGDFQLAKLLEEEKLLGSSSSEASVDKIDETKCHKCNKRFYRRSQLIRHLSNHVVHECLQCSAVFYCVKKYKKHMSTHETYPCDFCSEEFFDASAWYKHRAKHTMMECSCCDMIFYNKTSLAKHKFEHSEYICPLCGFACKNLHHWISHRNYHGRCSLLQPIIACRECKLTFSSQEVFLKHTCSKYNLSSAKVSPPLPPPRAAVSKPYGRGGAQRHSDESRHPPLSIPPSSRSKPFFKEQLLREQRLYAPPSTPLTKNKISRPEPFYLSGKIKKSRAVASLGQKSRYLPYSFPVKPFKRVMNKKDIKDLIGVDHTLTCSS